MRREGAVLATPAPSSGELPTTPIASLWGRWVVEARRRTTRTNNAWTSSTTREPDEEQPCAREHLAVSPWSFRPRHCSSCPPFVKQERRRIVEPRAHPPKGTTGSPPPPGLYARKNARHDSRRAPRRGETLLAIQRELCQGVRAHLPPSSIPSPTTTSATVGRGARRPDVEVFVAEEAAGRRLVSVGDEFLRTLYVVPAHWRSGVGTALHDLALERLRARAARGRSSGRSRRTGTGGATTRSAAGRSTARRASFRSRRTRSTSSTRSRSRRARRARSSRRRAACRARRGRRRRSRRRRPFRRSRGRTPCACRRATGTRRR